MTEAPKENVTPLFDGREDTRTEFKQQWSDTALKTAAAFMNTDGGVIYIGICDDRTICGIAEEKLDKTANHIGNILEAHFPNNNLYNIEFQTFENRTCIKIEVKKTNRLPVQYEGKYYKRNGVRTCIMGTEELFERFAVSNEPQAVLSAAISPFHAFLCDLSDASRLAFAYAMASSEKRIDLYQDNKRQIYEYVIKHNFYGKEKFASFKLSSKEYQGLLKNIQDAEKQGFVAPNEEVLEYWQETEKQGFKRGAADDGGYVIQASCERRTLQSFIDDELRTEFAKFPPFVLTILKIVCADPNRTIQVDTNGNVHLLRGYHADNELAEPLFQKVSPNDLLNAISFLYNRGGFDKPAGNRNTPSGFYIPTPQSFLIDTFRRERLDKVSPSASSHNF